MSAEFTSPDRSHEVVVEGVDRVFACREDQSVLSALAPIHRLAIESGCRGGGCGVCKVVVVAGEVVAGKMSAAHVNEGEPARGVGLACKLYPRSRVVLRVLAPRVFVPFGGAARKTG